MIVTLEGGGREEGGREGGREKGREGGEGDRENRGWWENGKEEGGRGREGVKGSGRRLIKRGMLGRKERDK